MTRFRWWIGFSLLLALAGAGCKKTPAAVAEADRDKRFQEMMSGVTLVGYSNRDGRSELSGEERYVIESVTHVAGDTWLFKSRLKYGGKDIPVPVPVVIKWAGDTPVITLTDFMVPGFGKFTSRVLIYRGQYAGTWEGGREPDGSLHGGNLFGVLEKIEKE